MPKISIYIPDRELERIDGFVKNNKYKRSVFLWKSAMMQISKIKGIKESIKCDYCRTPSIGSFTVNFYDRETGSTENVTKHLCQMHLDQAKTEGTVI